jgi:hypothetical protein
MAGNSRFVAETVDGRLPARFGNLKARDRTAGGGNVIYQPDVECLGFAARNPFVVSPPFFAWMSQSTPMLSRQYFSTFVLSIRPIEEASCIVS